MTLYCDTSALVKLYVAEDGRDDVLAAVGQADVVTVSVVAQAETRAALARRQREGRFNDSDHQQAVNVFTQDWSTFLHLPVLAPLARHAGELAQRYALRGFDAIHLATALHFADRFEDLTFLTFDHRLNDAARKASLLIYADRTTPTRNATT